ncbi:MAG: hypothetical protein V3U57_00820 [Robiginitomaculum sp.]
MMSGKEVREARLSLGLSLSDMALMLGYKSQKTQNLRTMQNDLENGSRNTREPQKRLIDAYMSGYKPTDWPKD